MQSYETRKKGRSDQEFTRNSVPFFQILFTQKDSSYSSRVEVTAFHCYFSEVILISMLYKCYNTSM